MAQPLNFGFGMAEQLLKSESRKFLKANCDQIKLMELVGGEPDSINNVQAHWDENTWKKAVELGWGSLAVPKRAQGEEMSTVGIAALVEESGRAACPSPLLATINASYLLNACRTEAADKVLRNLANGKAASLALMDNTGSWKSAGPTCCTVESDGIRINGAAWFVQDAQKVDVFIVRCKFDDGEGLIAVPADTAGLRIVPDAIVDLTHDQAHLEFKAARLKPEWMIAKAGAANLVIEKAEPAIFTMLAADMIGAAEWQLQTTTRYARQRVQFGHPIGFFQAVKHPIADMMLQIDRSKSLVYHAACAIDHEPVESLLLSHMAKSSASDMAAYCSDRSVQLHGGIGFTWECAVQVYFKRQLHHRTLFGDGRYHRARLAEMIMADRAGCDHRV